MAAIDDNLMERSRRTKVPARIGFVVEVTPIADSAGELFCEINGNSVTPHQYVKGGLIKLPVGGQPYTITFQLMPGIIPNLQFDTAQPFWSGSSCPTGGNDPQFQPQVPCNLTTCDVDAVPAGPKKNVIFYRMNFTDGTSQYYCDPIIVNN